MEYTNEVNSGRGLQSSAPRRSTLDPLLTDDSQTRVFLGCQYANRENSRNIIVKVGMLKY
jgi:hypothetical protein